MSAEQFEQLWILLFCIGLMVCFALGCVFGGQR
ncbi:tail virion protein G7P-2 [Aliivibrio fischeri]